MRVRTSVLTLVPLLAIWILYIEGVEAGIFGPPSSQPSPSGTPSGPPSPSSDPPSPSSEPPSPSGTGGGALDIQLVYLEPVSSEIESLFENAKERWASVFTDDFGEAITVEKGYEACGIVEITQTVDIQGLVVLVIVTDLDGPGDFVGQASPCLSDEAGLTRIGAIVFDSVDLDEIIQEGYGEVSMAHYFGHVFGFGVLWAERNLVGEVSDPDHELQDYKARYLGEEGNIGNEEVGLQFEAIVEEYGEDDEPGIHWEEEIYEDEVMTNIFPESKEVILSKLTIRSLADLGYSVDPDAADEFEVDPDVVDDLEFGVARAPNLRGSKSKTKDASEKPRRSFGNDILHKPNKVLKSKYKV